MGRADLTRQAADSSARVRASKRPAALAVAQEYVEQRAPLPAANLPVCGAPHLCKQDPTDMIIKGA
jgi:hypothetical protein